MGLIIGYVSDLHLEVWPKTSMDRLTKIANHLRGVDVVVVAGDFSSNIHHLVGGRLETQPLSKRIQHFCDKLGKRTEVVYVAGNHEYYTSSFEVVDGILKELDRGIPNFHFLNNDVVSIKGQRFVGTTLWFNHREHDVDIRLNDFAQIDDFSRKVEKRGKKASEFLVNSLAKDDILVTHHLPSWACVDPQRINNPMNRFYVHNHGPLIEEVKPKVCFHGHSHTSKDLSAEGTRYLRNPYGYEMYEVNPHFDYGAFVEV